MGAGGENRPPVDRSKIVRMLVIGAIASALGIAAGLAIDWFPAQGSTQAHKIDTLWDVLVVVSVPIFVLVAVVVLFSVVEFRMKPGEELADGPPIHGNTRLEVIWTAVPAIILVSLCTYAYLVLHDVEKAPANGRELKVDVYGQQFAWSFKYPKEVAGREFTSDQLYVPIGRSVQFRVHSADVIHDFWVPDWRMKIDAVPGITTKYRITPRLLGRHAIVCAELCGLGHAYMRQTAHVLAAGAFAAWLRRQGRPAATGGGGGGAAGGGQVAAADGKKLFTQGNGVSTPCASCHQLADAGSPQGVGPDLDKAIATWTPAQVKVAIVNPQKDIAKGYPSGVMPPNFGQTLKPAELDALVAYLVKATHKQ